jgi:muconolactone delta-isomerase
MQFLVIAEARDSIVGDAVKQLRADVATAIQRITASGKLLAGGILGGRRMAFLLLELDSTDEILELLGSELIDNMQCNVYPVVSFERIGQFFKEHPV